MWGDHNHREPLKVLELGHGTSRDADMGFTRPNGSVSHHLLFNKCARHGSPPWQQPSKVLAPRVPADDVHGSHGRQVCRRHELYVSFQDLGWLVSATLLFPKRPSPSGDPRCVPGEADPQRTWIVFIFLCFPSSLKGECVALIVKSAVL